jgi:dolichol-phosphate mannosyltransferase
VPGAWLILPTFNEAENIEPLVRAVLPQLEAARVPHTVLIVDDSSPDGTGEIADRLAAELEPADLPRLIAAAREADLVLGSRYVEGGGVEHWGLLRRALSRGGSWYARAVLRVPVRDLTGGFKCFRREVLETIALNDVHADGYGFQIELTYRAIQAGFRVIEVPIKFRERRVGSSKMTARIAVEAVWKVPALLLRGRRKQS